MNVYEFTVTARDGSEVGLSDYQGKVLLIVNTATGCGFTPQYKELQELYEAHHADGLEILDFPCNQFGEQAPGSDEEIHTFCAGRFGITFPQFAKVDVNGDHAIPLFRWLTANTKFEGFDKLHPIGMLLSTMLKKQDKNYKESSSVKWNFTKFLIGRDGEIIARFEPTANMKRVKAAVEEAL
ncbi:MAG: glutathione peroxidase [Christensenellaceae bacterium]|nr:glutathione peroxidase [Christensenellaceae bacterium]